MRECPLSRKRIVRLSAGLSALVAASAANPAQAALEAAIAPIVLDAVSRCSIVVQPLAPASAPTAALTKTAALLGGAPSALDAIRAQQSAVVPLSAPAPTMFADATSLPALTPGIDASTPFAAPCAGLAASRVQALPGTLTPALLPLARPEDFLASRRVRIAHTNFDKDWKRVRGETVSAGTLRRYVGTVPDSRDDSLAAINKWVNRSILYKEDRDQYGKSDFWAGARRTLRSGRGDCEDIALTKMQLLAAAGFSRDDMILTIARDLVRNADHAVLIVRTDNGYRLLDNATDEVLDAAQSHDYRAILSLGNQTSWLHGV